MTHDCFEEDLKYLERKFTDPAAYDPATGLSNEELRSALREMLAEEKESSHPVAKARAVAFVLDHVRIETSPHDWFIGLGCWGDKPVEAVYCNAWRKETVERELSADRLRLLREYREAGLLLIGLDYAHSVPDWDAILALGFPGLAARAARFRAEREAAGTLSEKQRDFFEAIRIEYEAISRFLDRLVRRAEERRGESDRMPGVAACLESLRSGPPKNIYEALQLIWLYFLLSESVDGIQVRSYGNLDRVLYPFFRRDLAAGTFTREEIRDFLRCFFYQSQAMHYYWAHPFYLGGGDPEGESEINELSRLMLELYDSMGIHDPKLQIKVGPETPRDFTAKALDMIRRGHSSIVFVGEPCIIRTMLRNGYTREEALRADVKGCYEYAARGCAVETAPLEINLAKILELVFHNGVDPESGLKFGPETGRLSDFDSFERFVEAYRRQYEHLYFSGIGIVDALEPYLDEVVPATLFSSASETALAAADDGYARASKYNNSNVWLLFPGNLGDSLRMIEKYVYERKLVSLEELGRALDADWRGYETLRAVFRNDREKFGNNQPRVDELTCSMLAHMTKLNNFRPNRRGGVFTTALHGAMSFRELAPVTGATPDGRRRGDELAKNISPASGMNWNGPTALIHSALKLDPADFAADFAVDLMLHPSAVAGEDGLEAMRALLDTYIGRYGHAIQFNVFDADTLRDAQKHPENYRNLQVRVCGWNVLWNNLSADEQDNYILQAEVQGN